MATSKGNKPCGCSTICLPFDHELYDQLVDSHAEFRNAIDPFFRDCPELFPDRFHEGYTFKDARRSAKLGIRLRVCVKANGQVFTIRLSFAMPYMTGRTDDAEDTLFLRRFGVPFWALARVWRVREWVAGNLSGEIRERALRLCGRGGEYGEACQHPGCHRTSVMLDRVMRGMSGYFDGGQHLHGSAEASRLHVRAWALLSNFTPWGAETQKSNGEWRCPAERFNQHRYHESWLQNLFVSASLAGFRQGNASPQNP